MRLIDADALYDKFVEIEEWVGTTDLGNVYYEINHAPTITPEREKGKWIDIMPAPMNMWYGTCSKCGERIVTEIKKFCPNCGVDMREGGAE